MKISLASAVPATEWSKAKLSRHIKTAQTNAARSLNDATYAQKYNKPMMERDKLRKANHLSGVSHLLRGQRLSKGGKY